MGDRRLTARLRPLFILMAVCGFMPNINPTNSRIYLQKRMIRNEHLVKFVFMIVSVLWITLNLYLFVFLSLPSVTAFESWFGKLHAFTVCAIVSSSKPIVNMINGTLALFMSSRVAHMLSKVDAMDVSYAQTFDTKIDAERRVRWAFAFIGVSLVTVFTLYAAEQYFIDAPFNPVMILAPLLVVLTFIPSILFVVLNSVILAFCTSLVRSVNLREGVDIEEVHGEGLHTPTFVSTPILPKCQQNGDAKIFANRGRAATIDFEEGRERDEELKIDVLPRTRASTPFNTLLIQRHKPSAYSRDMVVPPLKHELDVIYRHLVMLTRTMKHVSDCQSLWIGWTMVCTVAILALTITFLTQNSTFVDLPHHIRSQYTAEEIETGLRQLRLNMCWAGLQVLLALLNFGFIYYYGSKINEVIRRLLTAMSYRFTFEEDNKQDALFYLQSTQAVFTGQLQWGVSSFRFFIIERTMLSVIFTMLTSYAILLHKMKENTGPSTMALNWNRENVITIQNYSTFL